MRGADGAADRERMTRLWVEHAGDVRRFIARRLGRSTADADVEDLLGETFTVVWRRLHEAPAGVRPWVFVIARNLVLTHLRDEGRRHTLLEVLDQERQEGPTDPGEGLAEVDVLSRAWKALPVADREVLALVAWDGLENEDAARVLGCRVSTFAVRLHRARRRLGGLLELAEERRARRPAAGDPVRAGDERGSS